MSVKVSTRRGRRGGNVTHDCHVDESLATPWLAHPHTGASPPPVSVVEASAGGPDGVADGAPSVDSDRGGLTGLGTLEMKLNETVPKVEGDSAPAATAIMRT